MHDEGTTSAPLRATKSTSTAEDRTLRNLQRTAAISLVIRHEEWSRSGGSRWLLFRLAADVDARAEIPLDVSLAAQTYGVRPETVLRWVARWRRAGLVTVHRGGQVLRFEVEA